MLILLVWGPHLEDHWCTQDRAAGFFWLHSELLTPSSQPAFVYRIVSVYFPGSSSGLQALEGQHCDFSIFPVPGASEVLGTQLTFVKE